MGEFQSLVDVVARLRGPGGCPWDAEQTHESLKRNLLEECYETLEAIDAGEPLELAEELGDILVQVAFHADIARQAGHFNIADVLSAINRKLIRRHPHVFGSANAVRCPAGGAKLGTAESRGEAGSGQTGTLGDGQRAGGAAGADRRPADAGPGGALRV